MIQMLINLPADAMPLWRLLLCSIEDSLNHDSWCFFSLSPTVRCCFSSLKGDWFGICNETSGARLDFFGKRVAVDGHPPSWVSHVMTHLTINRTVSAFGFDRSRADFLWFLWQTKIDFVLIELIVFVIGWTPKRFRKDFINSLSLKFYLCLLI